MSGPIIRKYGFPNFEKIFGERPLEHGLEAEEPPADQAEGAGSPKSKSEESGLAKASENPKPKES